MSANNKIQGTKPGATHVTGPGGQTAGGFASWYKDVAMKCWQGLDLEAVERLSLEIERCEKEGKTIWVMGNGGSAATASHLATDLSKTAYVKGRKRIKCVCLNDNAAYMTAIGNDLSFDSIFSEQLEGLVGHGDLVILITGSGNSPNLLAAADAAKKNGAVTASLLGFDGGKLKGKSDFYVLVDSDQYGVIEDFHMSVGHMAAFWLKQRKAP
jgi:D-sedoheptulose 7-phosphate isomerase